MATRVGSPMEPYYGYFRRFEPMAKAGYSIGVYRVPAQLAAQKADQRGRELAAKTLKRWSAQFVAAMRLGRR